MTFKEMICRFRELPTPLLVTGVLSRFVFGFGLGAVLAGSKKSNWKTIGGVTMGAGLVMVLPAAMKVWAKGHCAEG